MIGQNPTGAGAGYRTIFAGRTARFRAIGLIGIVLLLSASVVRAQDDTPPEVTVNFPAGGESLGSASEQLIQWTAVDDSGFVIAIDVLISFDGGVTFDPLATALENSGELTWFVQNRPTNTAIIKVVALDPDENVGVGLSGPFTVFSTASGRIASTLRDFDMPGTQPLQVAELNAPEDCISCHGFYNREVEPHFNWQGSMMAHASIDPLFLAALDVARNDAPEVADFCYRCHTASAWLTGRANPTDGSQILNRDRHGVSCDACHRMVNPHYVEGESPSEDLDVLAGLRAIPAQDANSQFVIDPFNTRRRGPYDDAFTAGHEWLPSPFHRDSAQCATCHEISNPLLVRQADGTYALNALDAPAADLDSRKLFPMDRTYSEWFYSAFNTPEGVYAPQFGGNREFVSSCQHCHMRAVTGTGCNSSEAPVRDDLGLHDLTGGSTWMLSLIPQINPDVDPEAISAGIERSRRMLRLAATLELTRVANQLSVRVTNQTGHKLPGGYAEGRRMWLNVRFFDAQNKLLGESGAYDAESATLANDEEVRIYEALLTTSPGLAEQTGLEPGAKFHMVLSDTVAKDNRIPPLGFDLAAYEEFGGAPVGGDYADGQNYDLVRYTPPTGAVRAEVMLYYQSVSRAYAEFLRDNGTPGGPGQVFYDLWSANGKSPPEQIAAAETDVPTQVPGDLNCDGSVDFDDIDPFVLALSNPDAYEALFPTCYILQGDIDRSGDVNFDDIDPFVELLTG